MRYFGKRVLGAVLCAVLLVCTVPAGSIAVSAEQSGNFLYEVLEDGTAGIWGYTGEETDVVIPAEIDGHTVSTLGAKYWGSGFEGCLSLFIPASVTTIEHGALGATVHSSTLTAITVDDANPYFSDKDGVLYNKNQTLLVWYPAKKSDAKFTIPDSVTQVDNNAFSGCSGLTEVTIGAGVQPEISEYGTVYDINFGGCSSLSVIHVSDANPYYSDIDGVLFNKAKTELILYPPAKQGAYTIPNSVTGSASFSDCTGLTELTIPASVEWVNELDTCSSLTAIHVSDANPYYSDIDGVLFNKEKTELKLYPLPNRAHTLFRTV